MVAYSFRPRFVDPILSGRKRHTIRAEGKRRHAWPEQEVQLYTGMRTKACRSSRFELDDFAVRDGFLDWEQLADFWLDEHPDAYRAGEFCGVLITWGDLTARGV